MAQGDEVLPQPLARILKLAAPRLQDLGGRGIPLLKQDLSDQLPDGIVPFGYRVKNSNNCNGIGNLSQEETSVLRGNPMSAAPTGAG
jgi:hypothetical protein